MNLQQYEVIGCSEECDAYLSKAERGGWVIAADGAEAEIARLTEALQQAEQEIERLQAQLKKEGE